MKNTILVLFAAAFSTILSAQSKADITFGVSAVCGMCEERIETAFDVKGIVMADYDLKSKKLNVVYKTKVFPCDFSHDPNDLIRLRIPCACMW